MKTYEGRIDPSGNDPRWSVYVDDGVMPVEVELEHHVRHSPDGFAWGYGGSGPAETARCILIDVYGEDPHPRLYQAFKERFIATLDMEAGWRLDEGRIRRWVEQQGGFQPEREAVPEGADPSPAVDES